ncbi:aminotransferase [Halobacillus andaensis]|uniref:cysteine-S-conjugate beta-lyase n=1 Tax=Halobacillus andaensis TaxID=1176239 RepID=A0A917EYN7_HALAA|nr:MalY/PatB family protein [Halobacillus andaensis]MBP2005602.1 cystathionine beta-lyase [Halobacillus andaensis]GGF32771.1 aminotransferase [Halobacillus andaensis]
MSRFTTVIPRKGTRSVKWDYAEELYQDKDILPMWVADMDFQAPQAVIDSLKERVDHGVFGYTMPDEEIKHSITNWIEKRHQWKIQKDWVTYSPGVIPSLHMIVQSLTNTHDGILIQTPVYPPFFSVIKDHERKVVTNSLLYNEGTYSIDFEDFEHQIVEGDVKMFILCNPHNPIGRVWTKDELSKMGEICLKHNVLIVSDEIHADLILDNHKHIPMASMNNELSNQTLTCFSPTKTFNLAGLQASYIVTPCEDKRKKVKKQFDQQGMFMLNTLGLTAMESAYLNGEEWLEELVETIQTNRDFAIEQFQRISDQIQIVPLEGTYLLWMDCRLMNLSQAELKSFMQKQAKVGLNDGVSFGEEGEGFMRMNLAAPREIVEEGVNRIITAVHQKTTS